MPKTYFQFSIPSTPKLCSRDCIGKWDSEGGGAKENPEREKKKKWKDPQESALLHLVS